MKVLEELKEFSLVDVKRANLVKRTWGRTMDCSKKNRVDFNGFNDRKSDYSKVVKINRSKAKSRLKSIARILNGGE